ncbi:MAG TPA: hypothetical protein VFV89_22840 [Nocardioides sp.]|uniref:hypothetical protein n=1 Tax=Nocardioides sp. TaxID=35761 RepID=UPI002E34F30E|nr:hypothetical protein [Nocardioides sp.]HEX5090664.1 hypothetical protein [Nocardioides sp.]
MTDQPDALPELTPHQEADVRRRLAEARHDEPIPAEVAARLDRVLAGLSRDDPGSTGGAPVIDLAARRRRRNAAAVLAGAAAVIVAGFAIGQVVDVGSGSDDASSSSAADRATASNDSAGGVGLQGESAEPSAPVPSPAEAQAFLRLRSAHLERDLASQLGKPQGDASAVRSPTEESYAALGCSTPVPANKYAPDELYPALFDGRPAVVVLAPPAAGEQRADVLSCDTAATLATATIPAR